MFLACGAMNILKVMHQTANILQYNYYDSTTSICELHAAFWFSLVYYSKWGWASMQQ